MTAIMTDCDIVAVSPEQALPCIEAFARYAEPGAPFDQDKARQFWKTVLDRNLGILLGAFQDETVLGVIGMTARTNTYNDRITASELVWWMQESARQSRAGMDLLDAAEAWAVSIGAHTILLGHFDDEQSRRLSTIYRRKGFRPYGIGYTKELTHV